MSENLQRAPFYGTEYALQPSEPVLRNGTSSAEGACNFSKVSVSAVGSAWLLPSDSSTRGQQLMDSAIHYQQPGRNMMPVVTDQSQISTSALSYPGALQRDLTGSTDRREAEFLDFTVPNIYKNTTLSSLSMTDKYENVLKSNVIVPFYPILTASDIQSTPLQIPNQGYRLEHSYQEGQQVYYYDHNNLGLLKPKESDQCLQGYGPVSYSGSQVVTLRKDIQPMNIQTPFSTSAIDHATASQAMPETSLQGVEMQTSQGLTPSGQTLCMMRNRDVCNACIQDAQMKTQTVNGNESLTTTVIHNPSQFQALPTGQRMEQRGNNHGDEMMAEDSMPLKTYEGTKEMQDASLPPPTHIDIQQPLKYMGAESMKQKLASDNFTLGRGSPGLYNPRAVQNVMAPSIDFADMTTVVSDIHLPQLINNISDLVQLEDPGETQPAIRIDQAQEFPSIITGLSQKVNKKAQRACDLLHPATQCRIQCPGLVEGQGPDLVEREAPTSRAWVIGVNTENMAKHMEAKAQKSVTRVPSMARAPSHNKSKRIRENSSKTKEKLKPASHRVKGEVKPIVSKTKRKRNSPGLNNDSFKKPRTDLGRHMLEAVQVFHPLGKKSEKKTGISSSQALLNFSSNKVSRDGIGTTSLHSVPCDSLGCGKIPGHAHGPKSSAYKECPSSSQNETSSAGKVKLVPLPFLAQDKPQARPLPRKLPTVTSRKPTAARPVRPNSVFPQSTTLKSPRPAAACTSLTASDKPPLHFANSVTQPNLTNPIQSFPGSQPATSRPAPNRAASQTSLPCKAPSPPNPKTHYLLQDFSRQPIPWRKSEILGPVTSQPITEKQRPEREAMKRRAQQERENAVKFSSQGNLKIFLQREEDMEISRYYGYVM